jgi:hypothetical protein
VGGSAHFRRGLPARFNQRLRVRNALTPLDKVAMSGAGKNNRLSVDGRYAGARADITMPPTVKPRPMVTRLRAMDSRLHSASIGVFSTSGVKGRSELWPGACDAMEGVSKMHPKTPLGAPEGHLVTGNTGSLGMGRKYRIQACRGRGAATVGAAVAALWLRACACRPAWAAHARQSKRCLMAALGHQINHI